VAFPPLSRRRLAQPQLYDTRDTPLISGFQPLSQQYSLISLDVPFSSEFLRTREVFVNILSSLDSFVLLG
jgi:hypothetical protein